MFNTLSDEAVGARLRQLRERVNLNARQFALENSIDVSQYAKAERGLKGLSNNKLMDLSTKYKIPVEWLITGAGVGLTGQNEETQPSFVSEEPGAYNNYSNYKDKYIEALEKQVAMMDRVIQMSELAMRATEATTMLVNRLGQLESSLSDVQEMSLDHAARLEALHATVPEMISESVGRLPGDIAGAFHRAYLNVLEQRKTHTLAAAGS